MYYAKTFILVEDIVPGQKKKQCNRGKCTKDTFLIYLLSHAKLYVRDL